MSFMSISLTRLKTLKGRDNPKYSVISIPFKRSQVHLLFIKEKIVAEIYFKDNIREKILLDQRLYAYTLVELKYIRKFINKFGGIGGSITSLIKLGCIDLVTINRRGKENA